MPHIVHLSPSLPNASIYGIKTKSQCELLKQFALGFADNRTMGRQHYSALLKGPTTKQRWFRFRYPNLGYKSSKKVTKTWIVQLRSARKWVLDPFPSNADLDTALVDSEPTRVPGRVRTNLLELAFQERSKTRDVDRLTSERSWYQMRESIRSGNNWPSPTNWVAAKIEIFGMNWMSTLAAYLRSERCKCWTLNTLTRRKGLPYPTSGHTEMGLKLPLSA